MLKASYESNSNNWGEWRTELIITHKGKEIERHCDGGEPEDNSFMRDWNWIAEAIETAYNLGVKDADE